jgi:hypothetical protein
MVNTRQIHVSRIFKVFICQTKLNHRFSTNFRRFLRGKRFLAVLLIICKPYIFEHYPLSCWRILNLRQINVCNNVGVALFIRLSVVLDVVLSDLKRLLFLIILRSSLFSFTGFLLHMVWINIEGFVVH